MYLQRRSRKLSGAFRKLALLSEIVPGWREEKKIHFMPTKHNSEE